MLKKSIFGVDHISHGRTRPSRKLSDPAGRDSGFSAYVHRNQFAGPLSSANGTRPPKPQLSPMLNFRLFQHNRGKPAVRLNRVEVLAWSLVRSRYDDGGFSGGSMERPALTGSRRDDSAAGSG
jgi:hypothetical protein